MALKMGFFSSSDLLGTAHSMRRKYSIFTVTTSLSPLDLQTRNPTKSCWTQILRNTGFLSMQPPQTPARPWLVRQHINRDVGVCTYEAPCLFSSIPENTTRTGLHPTLSVFPQLLALNPKAAPPEHSHHPKHVQGPAKPLPWTQEKSLSATSQLCWYHRQKGKSLLIPTWLKLMLPLNTTQRYYYPTESSRKEKIPSALFCQSLQKSVILFNTFCPLYLWKLLKLEQVPK